MLADTCGGFAIWSMCDIDMRIAKIDMHVNYLKSAVATGLVLDAIIKLPGDRVGNVHIVVYPEENPDFVLTERRSVYNICRR